MTRETTKYGYKTAFKAYAHFTVLAASALVERSGFCPTCRRVKSKHESQTALKE
jgi:hypothetical protein